MHHRNYYLASSHALKVFEHYKYIDTFSSLGPRQLAYVCKWPSNIILSFLPSFFSWWAVLEKNKRTAFSRNVIPLGIIKWAWMSFDRSYNEIRHPPLLILLQNNPQNDHFTFTKERKSCFCFNSMQNNSFLLSSTIWQSK